MSPAELPVERVAPEVVPGIRILPTLHDRVDLAALTRFVLDRIDPQGVAVELPTTLAAAAERAVRRLPRISAVISEEPHEEALVWIVTPGDPLSEAMRWASERGRRVFLIDPDVGYVGRYHERYLDPHVAWELGPAPYFDAIRELARSAPRSAQDDLRERGMAFHLQRAREESRGSLVAVVGAAHAEELRRHLHQPTAAPLARQVRTAVNLHHLHPDSLTALLVDPPLAHAVYETLRAGELPAETGLRQAVSRRVELVRAGLRLITGSDPDESRERHRALVRFAARHGARIGPTGAPVPDRRALARVVWRVAAASYEEQTRESTNPWQGRLFFDFARRQAWLQGLLVPGLYEWVVAGRGVGDDNLAWEIFDAARSYPWQEVAAEIPTARVDGELLDLGTRKIRFRRRFFRVKQRLVAVPVRRRPDSSQAAQWLEGFAGDMLCSYPPEDLVLEDYGRFLQHKAVSILSAEWTRTEPFSTSMLDGIDLRETMLKWYDGRVYVREQGRAPGRAGSVVVIFDEDAEGTAFPYLMTWHGEHDQESDMAFYSTDPTRQIVGPGIMRATYGGLMLTYPPGRVFDVWQDDDYASARGKAEVLLMAGIDYSQEKLVVHVAPAPASARLRAHAAAQKKRIVHVPLGTLSPPTLRKLRTVHILAGQDKRAIAKDYVW